MELDLASQLARITLLSPTLFEKELPPLINSPFLIKVLAQLLASSLRPGRNAAIQNKNNLLPSASTTPSTDLSIKNHSGGLSYGKSI